MQQHPIPQQISSYQFRLVGDMTMKQFLQLAGGVLVALLIYALPIVSFFKWILIIFFVFFGFALAFLPLEDRPLEQWLRAFFKSIYTPTQFVWKKGPLALSLFQDQVSKISENEKKLPPPTPPRQVLNEYLESFSTPEQETRWERENKLALEKVESLFKAIPLPAALQPSPKTPVAPPQRLSDQLMPELKIKPRRLSVPPTTQVALRLGISPAQTKNQPITSPPFQPKSITKMKKKKSLPRFKIKFGNRKTGPSVQAKTSIDLPFPTTPTIPNIIVGMILDTQGNIVENAIVEIRDKDKLPVRALRSNQLGQFQIVTPLENGPYEIEVEKEGHQFAIIQLSLKGEIVSPIEIRAQ
ncbi:PrgI family mobile element protein [Patescibacteria group bacterium]